MTTLQAAITARIAGRPLRDVAAEANIDPAYLSRGRRGTWVPNTRDGAERLALWLGWTVAQVWEAARTPAAVCEACGQVITGTRTTTAVVAASIDPGFSVNILSDGTIERKP